MRTAMKKESKEGRGWQAACYACSNRAAEAPSPPKQHVFTRCTPTTSAPTRGRVEGGHEARPQLRGLLAQRRCQARVAARRQRLRRQQAAQDADRRLKQVDLRGGAHIQVLRQPAAAGGWNNGVDTQGGCWHCLLGRSSTRLPACYRRPAHRGQRAHGGQRVWPNSDSTSIQAAAGCSQRGLLKLLSHAQQVEGV